MVAGNTILIFSITSFLVPVVLVLRRKIKNRSMASSSEMSESESFRQTSKESSNPKVKISGFYVIWNLTIFSYFIGISKNSKIVV